MADRPGTVLNLTARNSDPLAVMTIDQEMIPLEVEGNGPGMSEDIRKHIFEPVVTTKNVGVGTGLGLSIIHSIVNRARWSDCG